MRHVKGKRSIFLQVIFPTVINSIKKLHLKQCTALWDLSCMCQRAWYLLWYQTLSRRVLPEPSSFPWQRTWLTFQAPLINIRCYIVPVNTMANGNYRQILNNFMGELPSPPGNMASWRIRHWQPCNTSALLLAFDSLVHVDICGCCIHSVTEKTSQEKTFFLLFEQAFAQGLFICVCVRCTSVDYRKSKEML